MNLEEIELFKKKLPFLYENSIGDGIEFISDDGVFHEIMFCVYRIDQPMRIEHWYYFNEEYLGSEVVLWDPGTGNLLVANVEHKRSKPPLSTCMLLSRKSGIDPKKLLGLMDMLMVEIL